MKYFSERNPVIIGLVGVVMLSAIAIAAVQYKNLPFINPTRHYSAYFAETGGLLPSADVEVSGFKVGKVSGIKLDGARVLISFKIDRDISLGDQTEAVIRTKSLLGTKLLQIRPRGSGRLSGPIPLERTTPPYQIPDALGDLATTVENLDTDQLSQSLATLADTFRNTPEDLQVAVQGVARFSQTLNDRDAQLRALLTNANKATGVLAERTDKVVSLIANTNALLGELQTQSRALDELAANIGALSREVTGFTADNRTQLRPALDKLNGVLTIVNDRKDKLQKSIKLINLYGVSFGEALSSGPFFKAYLANLLPGQFIQPFVEAAFSDLGLDPNVLLPSQLSDPQTGQRATPALPVPFPRTGQGGEPHLTLPDAITGNPGDPRYPYREPLPPPPPSGPPPGPPALAPGQTAAAPAPTPPPVYVTAPGEPPPSPEVGQ